ncbi:pyruvate dehydrogenase E1 component alpha subunit [Ignavigranum ruoffiae]|uniref:Pyruvate dehydrogenase E1 component subunit alpha n=1 Tax=Ignavigranum ruoffiae TaxID=89093 RepID=A0A1H9AMV4_9LACT|nr:pyruvate dehydrogenase (acetyl-transferring) E1 component subunit alpha [Ignavigranum ruoffiae]SEP77885.1 pyruvate dehydrogenase E1 component alpha subunit [Ignavigranum ruoffiae]
MVNKQTFEQLLDPNNFDFETVQVLNEEGKIVNEDLMPDLTDEELVTLMEDMVWEREWYNRTKAFSRQGRLGFVGPTEGQEASQMATISAMEPQDRILPGYRDIPQLVKKGMPYKNAFLWSKGHVAGSMYPEDFHAYPPQIIIGAQFVQAAGVGLGIKKKKEDAVVITYTGDGGSSQGDTYEGMNFAGAFKSPVIFVIQNNGWAISTPRERQTAAPTLAQKAVAAGIPGIQVDGMDALAIYAVTKAARAYAAAGNGPVLIETLTYRYGPHSLSGDDPKRYQPEGVQETWRQRDPLNRMRIYLTEKGLWSEEKEEAIVNQTKELAKEAIKEADATPKQKVSDFLKNMFETPDTIIQEQIEHFEAKERN